MIDKKTGEPYINVWFGNFYRPAYDGGEFIDSGVKFIKNLGFNSILLDSKAWQDFHERYEGGEASPYVAAQEHMMKSIISEGLSYNHMALYLNADNLYPNIRFSPPIYGESIIDADGNDGKWYRYWSDKAKDSMIEHVSGLYKLYSGGFVRCETKDGKNAEIMCTMWDPIVAPSFDAEGTKRYADFLKSRYKSIDELNKSYGTEFDDFSDIDLHEVWFDCAYDAAKEYKNFTPENPAIIMKADNMKWSRGEICNFFADMQQRLKTVSPDLFTCPCMAQWSYFLNIDASALSSVGLSDLWDTANRGIDVYKTALYVDAAHFITVPITPFGIPDAYVSSCQYSMMRVMNEGRDFIGGIYWGRFLYSDIYEFLTPCEIIGSMAAAGVDGYTSYGMCGMDDGGVLNRMPSGFCDSLRVGNEWAKRVIPKIKGRRKKQIAILFPSAMALIEPMAVEGNKERRCDLLGFYKMCSDFGYMADVIDADTAARGALKEYSALIIPENSCYALDVNTAAEKAIEEWVLSGGTLISSVGDKICERIFGIKGKPYNESHSIEYYEGGLSQSDVFEYFDIGDTIANYRGCDEIYNKAAVVKNDFGNGSVYSFGFAYGYSYCAQIAPHVPIELKNNEYYPIPMMKRNIINDIFECAGIEKSPVHGRNIESAVFDDCMVIVNHTSQPLNINFTGEKDFQYDINDEIIMPRSAVYIKIK